MKCLDKTKTKFKIGLQKTNLGSGANLIKLATPTPKLLRWRNYNKKLIQSFMTFFFTQNYAKKRFLASILV
jgi:hypothetical protein